MKIEDHLPAPTVARVSAALEVCYRALSRGVEVAEALHAQYGWDPKGDPHMYSHAVRREALEVLRAQHIDADEEEEDSEYAPMSALHLRVGDTDRIRIWHGTRGVLRAPSSESGLKFVKQPPSTLTELPGFEPAPVPETCHTILMWEQFEGQLSRFTLVRPLDVEASHVVVDWHEALLLRFAERVEDVQYTRRRVVSPEVSQKS